MAACLAVMPCLARQTALQHSEFRHNATGEYLQLSNRYKPVDSRVATLDAQLQSGARGTSAGNSYGLGDEVVNLCKEGHLDRALDVLSCMDQQGILPSVYLYRSLLKACAKRKALALAKRVYAHLVKNGLESTRSLGEDMVKALVKCGGLEDAMQMFHLLPHRTVVAWTAVLSGYTKAGQGQQALSMFQLMREEGVQPNKYTFISLITACGSTGDLEKGRLIHSEAVTQGCATDLFVGTCLVDMYAKCGSLVDAQAVFDGLLQRDVVSWNAMLAGYAQRQQPEKAWQLYGEMQEEGVSATDRTFVSVIQACGMLAEKEEAALINEQLTKVGFIQVGKTLHAKAWRTGYASDVFVVNSLVSMYAKCGSIVDAQNMFDGLSQKDVVSWTSILATYAQNGQGERAWEVYENMSQEAIAADDRTYVSALQACGSLAANEEGVLVDGQMLKLEALQKGKQINAAVHKAGYEADVFVSNALISMYGKCGCVENAYNVFDALLQRNVVSWNTMLTAFIQQGQAEEALQLYGQMPHEGVSPNQRTFVTVLQACGLLAEKDEEVVIAEQVMKAEALQPGKEVHAEVRQRGYESDVFVGNTLISMYGKCGSIADAQNVFDGISQRNVVSWTVMVAAYARQGQAEKALELYKLMKAQGASPNEITFMHILQACSSTGGLDICRHIHRDLVSTGEKLSLVVASTLIHTYAKCARMADAQGVFDALPEPDVVAWNALIAGYARQGNFEPALQSFQAMQVAGMKPNGIIFLSILSACSHAGMVDRGVEYLEFMSKTYGIIPKIEHYATVVDLLGRAGYFMMVEDLLSKMPLQPDLSLWLCLLGACQKHSNLVLGKRAFDSAVQLEPKHAAAYVLMSNIYADAGLWEQAKEVYQMRQKAGAWKQPGQSWVEHQHLQTFVVGGWKHKQQQEIHELLRRLNETNSQHTDVLQRRKLCNNTDEVD